MELKEKWIGYYLTHGEAVNVGGEEVFPESHTQIAIGKVKTYDEQGNNNVRVVVEVAGATYDFPGYINSGDPVANLLKQAKDEDHVICVRFEKKRKKDVDPKATIASITKDANTAKKNIVNIIAGVYNFNESSWVLSNEAVSNPANDPESVQTELDTAQINTKNFFGGPATPSVQADIDEKANQLIELYNFASKHNAEQGLDLKVKALKSLATNLLLAVDKLQVGVYELESANYSDLSHAKAKELLFAWVQVNPITTELLDKKGGFSEWVNSFLSESTDIWTWARS